MRKFSREERFTARQLAINDFYFFTRWMFLQKRGYNWLQATHHKVICNALMRVFRGESKRLIINIPPRYSKTELAVVNFVAWCFGQATDSEFIHASYSATLATNNSSNIRSIMQHEAYQEIFPDVILDSEVKNHWTTSKGGVFYATGAGGTITGFGAGKQREGFGGAIIIDDPHKAEEARSEKMRQNVIDWFQNTIESRKNDPKNTPIIVIMQRLHESDLAGWLIEGGNGEEWEILKLPAIQMDGTPLWPEKHDLVTLKQMQKAAPYMFAGQYMQEPSPLEGGVFKPHNIEIINALPTQQVKWCRAWDLGATVGGDPTAGVKLGKCHDGSFIIADLAHADVGPDERDNLIKNTASLDGTNVKISIPQDPGQAGKTQALYLTRMLTGYIVKTSPESGDKLTRAEPFAAQVNIGNVKMLKGEWNKTVIDEMRLFPNGTHDDVIDALSRAFGEIIDTKTSFFG
ncbi:putative phage terminase large subunit-like protein [Volucribacter psittacicida]|uniref:Putative phage terminase large subunit-like protein n=1 Tax=Volucribacter psittacicida TaxID=203482 RepID=A0A4R1FN14_9PAST|nr:phage terminase large subunit [Volucribacter psittacicida]TCJ96157.1 putative phage terminase large subunit-like protein [Volucribacter psittacicida]